MTSQHPTVVRIRLLDETEADLRPIGPEDRPLLAEGLEHMSEESRFARFGSGISHLTGAELSYLTELDLVNHVAWGALIGGQPAGVGRFIVSEQAGCAEIAIAVVDRFQRRGLGRALFDALVASARENGVETLCFSIAPSNRSVMRMIRGVDVTLDEAEGMVTGRIAVEEVGPVDREEEYVRLLVEHRDRAGEPVDGDSPPTSYSEPSGSSSNDAELMQ